MTAKPSKSAIVRLSIETRVGGWSVAVLRDDDTKSTIVFTDFKKMIAWMTKSKWNAPVE